MFRGPYNLILYLVALLAIPAGAWFDTNLFLLGACGLFLVWNLFFVASMSSFAGRDPKQVIEHATASRTYLSYFIPFYGIVLGILFTMEPSKQKEFMALCSTAGVPFYLLLLPMLLASIALLSIPIQLADQTSQSITTSLKCLLFVNVTLQSWTILVFVHCIFRICLFIRP